MSRRVVAIAAVLVAVAFLYTAPHVAIGGTFSEFLVGVFVLLPVGLASAFLAWRTLTRSA